MKSRIAVVSSCVVIAGALFLARSYSQSSPKIASGPDHESEQQVRAVFKQMEKAIRDGDPGLGLSLYDRATRASMLAARGNAPARKLPSHPGVHYEALEVAARDDHAALIGKITGVSHGSVQYDRVRFVREDGAWKVAEEVWSEHPADPAVLYAMLPPADGAFARDGSPWQRVPYSSANTRWFKPNQIDWRLQAARDESFLYVRFEHTASLPPPNSELDAAMVKAGKSGPPMPPVMRIFVAGNPGARRPAFRFQLAGVIQTRATFGPDGRATSNRYFIQYAMSLSRGDNSEIFSASSDQSYPQLIAVQGRFLEGKIPLQCLGLGGKSATPVDLEEANSVPKILTYHVQPFSR
ncbi:MAG TPA: hypothetical protein VFZ27_00430 [Terriglobia bacterium]|nr:hypothetical protein [Terriglobia bacterium]